MYPPVEFPELVKHYAPFFQDVFSPEAFLEFERYVSGLIVSENKTVDGINRLFVAESRNQSSLNRLLTDSPFSLAELNRARLGLLASLAGTQIKPKGVLGVDDTLLIHYGQDFEKIAKLFDHVTQSYVWAHDLVTIHYSDEETDYPLLFQLWEPAQVEKLEAGLRAAGIPLKGSKEKLKESDPKRTGSVSAAGLLRHSTTCCPGRRGVLATACSPTRPCLSHKASTHPSPGSGR
ncbi:MAG: transposase [Chloroflexota bacterium]